MDETLDEPYDFGTDPIDGAEANVDQGTLSGATPEVAGRTADLSAQTGVPYEVIKDEQLKALGGVALQRTRRDVMQKHQDVAQWMADNPIGAVAAQDDLAGIERVAARMSYWKQYNEANKPPGLIDRLDATVVKAARFPVTGIASLMKMGSTITRAGAMIFGLDDLEAHAAEVSSVMADSNILARQAFGQTYEEAARDEARLKSWNLLKVSIGQTDVDPEAIGAALFSLGPTLAVRSLGYAAVLATSGLQTATDTFDTSLNRGDSGGEAALLAAVTGGLTAALTHFTPNLDKAFLAAYNPQTAARAVFAGAIGKHAAGEMAQEGLDEFAQTFILGLTDRKSDAGLKDIVYQSVEAALAAGLIGGIIGGGVSVGAARQETRLHEGEAFASKIQELAGDVDATKLNVRSKSLMQDLLKKTGLGDTKAYVAGKDVVSIMSQAGTEDRQALANAGISMEEVAAAARDGGTIEMEVAQVLTLPSSLRDALIDVVRPKPDGFSRKEATEAKDEIRKKVTEEADKPTGAQQVQAKLKTEVDRSVKALVDQGMPDHVARESIEKTKKIAMYLFERSPANASTPAEFLRKISLNKNLRTPEDIQQAVVDLAGPSGKTALTRMSIAAIGPSSGRFDALTGQVTLDPTQDVLSIAKILDGAQSSELDLAGKTVTLGEVTMDATAAVSTLRAQVEAARRLAACL